jgi:hypothetical protein
MEPSERRNSDGHSDRESVAVGVTKPGMQKRMGRKAARRAQAARRARADCVTEEPAEHQSCEGDDAEASERRNSDGHSDRESVAVGVTKPGMQKRMGRKAARRAQAARRARADADAVRPEEHQSCEGDDAEASDHSETRAKERHALNAWLYEPLYSFSEHHHSDIPSSPAVASVPDDYTEEHKKLLCIDDESLFAAYNSWRSI